MNRFITLIVIVNLFVSVTNEEAGYLVAVRFYRMFLCAGTYVSDKIVITAAHCIWDRMEAISALTVQGGITSLSEKARHIPVIEAYIPQEYDHKTNNFDFAALKLKESFTNPKVQSINICSRRVKVNRKVKLLGWGHTKYHTGFEPEQTLRSVSVPVVERSVCAAVYQKVTLISATMLCAGVQGKIDAGQYDSGGPLVYRNELCGIVSFGVGCASTKYPGVYTDVYKISAQVNAAIQKLQAS